MKFCQTYHSTEIVSDLVTSLLAVNGWKMEQVWKLIPELEKRGLLDPSKVRRMDVGEITVKLTESNFNRGMLNGMMAERLKTLMIAIDDGALSSLPEAIEKNCSSTAADILTQVRGIGPVVAQNAWLLFTSKKPSANNKGRRQ